MGVQNGLYPFRNSLGERLCMILEDPDQEGANHFARCGAKVLPMFDEILRFGFQQLEMLDIEVKSAPKCLA